MRIKMYTYSYKGKKKKEEKKVITCIEGKSDPTLKKTVPTPKPKAI